jgi:hypothetical protein
MLNSFIMNVKAHIRATEDTQNNQTDGGALCDASCSASSLLEEMAAEYMLLDADFCVKYPNHQISSHVKLCVDGRELKFYNLGQTSSS